MCTHHFLYSQGLITTLENATRNLVSISKSMIWSSLPWKSFYDLFSSPLCRGVSCNIEMNHFSTIMAQNNKHKQHLKPNR
ncbi:MAG: hypothetical protein ACI9VI_001742 [Candidatus Azotimanducaceae bacterium]|jgi:hypothetical protein